MAKVAYEGYMKDVKDVIGFDPRNASKDDIEKAIDAFNTLKADPRTFSILTDFAKKLSENQHELEYWRNGSGILFGIIISSILFYLSGGTASGAAVASLGLIVKTTSAAKNLMKKLGEVLVRIIEVAAKLPKYIKRKNRRHAENRNPIISELEDQHRKQENKRKNDERDERSNNTEKEKPDTESGIPNADDSHIEAGEDITPKITEAQYRQRIERLESIYGTSNVHSLEKHGAQTKGIKQYRRVQQKHYPNPTTGAPRNKTKTASKFLTNKDHYEVLRSAILQKKANPEINDFDVVKDRNIGVNIKNLGSHKNRGPYSADYTNTARVRFDPNSGKFFTAFPTPENK